MSNNPQWKPAEIIINNKVKNDPDAACKIVNSSREAEKRTDFHQPTIKYFLYKEED